jgi:hypothetical protein
MASAMVRSIRRRFSRTAWDCLLPAQSGSGTDTPACHMGSNAPPRGITPPLTVRSGK